MTGVVSSMDCLLHTRASANATSCSVFRKVYVPGKDYLSDSFTTPQMASSHDQ